MLCGRLLLQRTFTLVSRKLIAGAVYTHLPARNVETALAWVRISAWEVLAKRSQKYRRSGSVRTLFMKWRKGCSGPPSLCRVMIARTLATLQISVPTRKGNGKGRGGIEDVLVYGCLERMQIICQTLVLAGSSHELCTSAPKRNATRIDTLS
jgi:hypothetical protein